MPMNVTISPMHARRHQFGQHERACRNICRPSRFTPVPRCRAESSAYMQANASSMPIIQNQIGILPSKYCTACSSPRSDRAHDDRTGCERTRRIQHRDIHSCRQPIRRSLYMNGGNVGQGVGDRASSTAPPSTVSRGRRRCGVCSPILQSIRPAYSAMLRRSPASSHIIGKCGHERLLAYTHAAVHRSALRTLQCRTCLRLTR